MNRPRHVSYLPQPPHRRFQFFRNAAIRVGLYTGVCLSLVFTAWLLVANRIPFLEPLAQQRNLAATVLLLLIAVMPVFRFLRSPAELAALRPALPGAS